LFPVCGLSPLARGTPLDYRCALCSRRFIPAGAGNTSLVRAPIILPAVYPRWRGEHEKLLVSLFVLGGLSPLARGTPDLEPEFIADTRFIPAGAGNTSKPGFAERVIAVYPRWRGEHVVSAKQLALQNGLSPLARGTRLWPWFEPDGTRFIPAGAGNTLFVCCVSFSITVYPRWRGEHKGTFTNASPLAGLSPLARGTPLHFRSHV